MSNSDSPLANLPYYLILLRGWCLRSPTGEIYFSGHSQTNIFIAKQVIFISSQPETIEVFSWL